MSRVIQLTPMSLTEVGEALSVWIPMLRKQFDDQERLGCAGAMSRLFSDLLARRLSEETRSFVFREVQTFLIDTPAQSWTGVGGAAVANAQIEPILQGLLHSGDGEDWRTADPIGEKTLGLYHTLWDLPGIRPRWCSVGAIAVDLLTMGYEMPDDVGGRIVDRVVVDLNGNERTRAAAEERSTRSEDEIGRRAGEVTRLTTDEVWGSVDETVQLKCADALTRAAWPDHYPTGDGFESISAFIRPALCRNGGELAEALVRFWSGRQEGDALALKSLHACMDESRIDRLVSEFPALRSIDLYEQSWQRRHLKESSAPGEARNAKRAL